MYLGVRVRGSGSGQMRLILQHTLVKIGNEECLESKETCGDRDDGETEDRVDGQTEDRDDGDTEDRDDGDTG